MKRTLFSIIALAVLLMLSACKPSSVAVDTPTATLSPPPDVSPTAIIISPTEKPSPTSLPTGTAPAATQAQPTATPGSTTYPAAPASPLAVILVKPDDVLNIRSGAGIAHAVVGAFSSTAKDIQPTGLTATALDSPWLEVKNPAGGVGWVNAVYLTEYVAPAAFCNDARVTQLLEDFKQSLNNADGELLSSLVSPAHGLTLYYRRYTPSVNYTPAQASWLFHSTYRVNWGAGASGIDDIGTFREIPLPKLMDVLNAASYEQRCNDQQAASMYLEPWPLTYSNINFYALYKPGSPDIEFDWRVWLAGVEYVQGKPYLFALIHFEWEP